MLTFWGIGWGYWKLWLPNLVNLPDYRSIAAQPSEVTG
mgnify:CR=1 FL=1